jgi:hypothetical protein
VQVALGEEVVVVPEEEEEVVVVAAGVYLAAALIAHLQQQAKSRPLNPQVICFYNLYFSKFFF